MTAPAQPLPEPKCPSCGSKATTACYLVDSSSSYITQCHGMSKDIWGISTHQSPVVGRVCVACGYIMLFADKPAIFRVELPQGTLERGDLPLPASLEPLSPADQFPRPASEPGRPPEPE